MLLGRRIRIVRYTFAPIGFILKCNLFRLKKLLSFIGLINYNFYDFYMYLRYLAIHYKILHTCSRQFPQINDLNKPYHTLIT